MQITLSYNEKVTSIAFLNAETVLHDYWGGPEYWMIRRSMRFNSFLVEVANNFRREVLNSTDAYDATERPKDWRHEMVFIIIYYSTVLNQHKPINMERVRLRLQL